MLIASKIFTRDFPVVLCQVWGKRYTYIFGKKVKTVPRQISVCHDGLVATYRSPSLNQDINDILLSKVVRNKKYISALLEDHKDTGASIKKRFSDGDATREKFVDFLDNLFDFWEALYVSLYVPTDERFSKSDRSRAMVLRKDDNELEYEIFNQIDVFLKTLYGNMGSSARYMYLSEIKSGTIPDREELEARAKATLFVVDDQVLSETEFNAFKKQFEFELEDEKDAEGVTEIRGQIACAGKASGRVRIIMKQRDVSLLKKGEVLVSSMTVPSFLPAMQKAVAFVTEEGGITCHAAIVAREMQKPCIIGTKIATKVFKDGDLVEVDATKGVVSKIK